MSGKALANFLSVFDSDILVLEVLHNLCSMEWIVASCDDVCTSLPFLCCLLTRV